MKKALLFIVAILILSCSPDDSPSPNVPDNNPVADDGPDLNAEIAENAVAILAEEF